MPALDPLKKAAIYAMSLADEGGDVARAADDWGWKGGKPGELTGTEMERLFAYERDPDFSIYHRLPVKKRAKINEQHAKQVRRFVEKYPKSVLSQEIAQYGDRSPVVFDSVMAGLEGADIPREWTGRVAASLGFSDVVNSPVYRNQKFLEISDAMREMTNDQRETFLALLPEWEGSLDDLADTARSL